MFAVSFAGPASGRVDSFGGHVLKKGAGMAKKKRHFGRREDGDALILVACGRLEPVATMDERDVDCRDCKRELAKRYVDNLVGYPRPRPSREIAVDEAPGSVDESTGLPFVSRETWLLIKGEHYCGSCAYCAWLKAFDAQENAKAWKRKHQLQRLTRFSNVSHAITWYLDQEEDGYSQSPGMGWASMLGQVSLDYLDERGRLKRHTLGQHTRLCANAVTPRSAIKSTPKAEAEADDKVIVEKAITTCYLDPDERGLSQGQRLRILFDRTAGRRDGLRRRTVPAHELAREIGHGLTGPALTAYVERGKRHVFETLHRAEMVEAL